jgi:hypothetical protein
MYHTNMFYFSCLILSTFYEAIIIIIIIIIIAIIIIIVIIKYYPFFAWEKRASFSVSRSAQRNI